MNGDFIKDLHFHKIFNHLNDGIFIADQYGYAIWVNETSTKQIGAPRSKIIGKHVDDLESKGFFTPSVTKIVLEKKDVVSKVQTSNGRQFLATGYPCQRYYRNSKDNFSIGEGRSTYSAILAGIAADEVSLSAEQ